MSAILADVHLGEIVFVDVADDPHVGKVGDGEWIRGAERLHAGRSVIC